MSSADDLWNRELSPDVVSHLLSLDGPVPRQQRLPPSRLLLLQAYDAAHTRPGGRYQPCVLQQVRKGMMMNRQLRLAATVELYRKLTGDGSTPAEMLSKEAEAVAKKRDAAQHTPSASMRRWLGDVPLSSTAQAHLGSIAVSGRERTSVSVTGQVVGNEVSSAQQPAASPQTPGPGFYKTSNSNMASSVDVSRKSAAFVASSTTPRRRAQTPPPGRVAPDPHTPRASSRSPEHHRVTAPAFYYSAHNTIGKRTRSNGHASAAFASRTVAHETRVYKQQPYGVGSPIPSEGRKDGTPGPGDYETSHRDLSKSYNKFRGSANFAARSPRQSGALEPAFLSGPLKPTALMAPASYMWELQRGGASEPQYQPQYQPHGSQGYDPATEPMANHAAIPTPADDGRGTAFLPYGAAAPAGATNGCASPLPPRPLQEPISSQTCGAYAGSSRHATPSPRRREPFNARSTSAPHMRPSPNASPPHPQSQSRQRGEASRLSAERAGLAELQAAEYRAAKAMDELARVHAELNLSARGGQSPLG